MRPPCGSLRRVAVIVSTITLRLFNSVAMSSPLVENEMILMQYDMDHIDIANLMVDFRHSCVCKMHNCLNSTHELGSAGQQRR